MISHVGTHCAIKFPVFLVRLLAKQSNFHSRYGYPQKCGRRYSRGILFESFCELVFRSARARSFMNAPLIILHKTSLRVSLGKIHTCLNWPILLKSFRVLSIETGVVERATGKAQRGGADGRAKDIERAQGDPHAFARLANDLLERDPAIRERERAQRVRSDDVDRAADRQAAGVGIDHDSQETLLAGLGPPAEHHVVRGDAGIRDPGLAPVDDDG